MAKLNLNSVYSGDLSRKKRKNVQDVQEEVIPIIEGITEEIPGYGHTQGNKSGEKLKRINVQFTLKNHEYIQAIAQKNGITISKYINYFLNQKVDRTQNVQEVVQEYKIQNKNNKRINMGFTSQNYEWLTREAAKRKLSPSAFLNQLIEIDKG